MKKLYNTAVKKRLVKLKKLKKRGVMSQFSKLKLYRQVKRRKRNIKRQLRKALRNHKFKYRNFNKRKQLARKFNKKQKVVTRVIKPVVKAVKKTRHNKHKLLSKQRRLSLRRVNHRLRKPRLMFGDYYPTDYSVPATAETSQIVQVRRRRRYKKRNMGGSRLHNRVDFAYRVGSEREHLLNKWVRDSQVAKDKAYAMSSNKFDAT